jgi:uncharacterized protein DUF6599
MRNLLLLLLPSLAFAGVWPDTFGAFHRTGAQPLQVSERPLWDEYGLQLAEQARYESATGKFTATAYQLQDSTGALGAFDWQRPANAKPSALGKLAVETADSVMLAHGNYLLFFQGYKPTVGEIGGLIQTLPRLDESPLPALSGYLPESQLVPNSERYITGPVGLDRFSPGIPPSTAAFHLGAEAQLGSFRTSQSEMKLAVFSYPTPQIARERLVDFQRISGAMAKRTGPLVAVILAPASPDDAERLLAQVRYEPNITWSERVPTRRDNIGDLVINAFELIGILLAFCVVAGLAYGGVRSLRQRAGPAGEPDAMITLHLMDR